VSIRLLIPDPETLVALAPEELSYYILQMVPADGAGTTLGHIDPTYPPHGNSPYCAMTPNLKMQVEIAMAEAWQWLESQLLIVPSPGANGTNGFRLQGRRARGLKIKEQFGAFRRASSFPKELLHPSIAERAWLSLMRGDLEEAVFNAFKSVEVAVRDAGMFAETDIGVNLIRRAFNPDNGPLTRLGDPAAEREALMQLFAGAIGSYKNPTLA
jgi:uncharacterized protein (TIGR02391 family)